MSVSAAELAARARRHSGVRLDAQLARSVLVDWKARGIVEEPFPGRWRLTRSGAAMFGAWATGLDGEEPSA